MTLDPIAFDPAAAEDARQACRRLADALDRAANARRHDADLATEEWLGRWRDDFDRRIRRLDHEIDEVRQRLLRAAAGIDDAVDEAVRENRRRAETR
jgi:hypothetical protein